jgi:uncharacterized damage-inducible protein DinB
MDTELIEQFKDAACRKLEQDISQIARCAALLNDEQAWWRPNEHCNSVANLALHLAGNIRQWIVAGLGGEAFARDRPAEFAARGPQPLAPIVAELLGVVERARSVISCMDAASLSRRYGVQGYDVSGLQAVFHVAEHISFHTGQIVHITKTIRDVDLSLYDDQGRRRAPAGGKPW